MKSNNAALPVALNDIDYCATPCHRITWEPSEYGNYALVEVADCGGYELGTSRPVWTRISVCHVGPDKVSVLGHIKGIQQITGQDLTGSPLSLGTTLLRQILDAVKGTNGTAYLIKK